MNGMKAGPGQYKHKFSPEEDIMLKAVVKITGGKDWNEVAKHIPGRNARQCRERWNNYVNPIIENAPWTPREDELLCTKVAELGSKWQIISTFFPRRSKNSIKNHWISMQRAMKKNKAITESPQNDRDWTVATFDETLSYDVPFLHFFDI